MKKIIEQKSDTLSAKDITRWGVLSTVSIKYSNSIEPIGCYIVRLPENTLITDDDGKVVVQTSKEKTIGFVDQKTGVVGVEKEEYFFISLPQIVPTLSDINDWKAREKSLTSKENLLLNAYVERNASYGENSKEAIELRKKGLRNSLIKDKDFFDRMIEAEKSYQSMSLHERRIYDRRMHEKEIRMRRDREMQLRTTFGRR